VSELVFGKQYADQYDLLYGDKNYEAECDMLREVFKRYAKAPIQTILDLGCGTGNHAIPLARRGYRVTGVDRSAEMLANARQKARASEEIQSDNLPVLTQGDVRRLDLGQQFDAVLMMFAVLGYQLTNSDVLAALSTVRRHLKPGGLFICDVWYGPAVLAIRPSDRIKVIPMPDGQVIRAASSELDLERQRAKVHYHVWCITGGRLQSETEETHHMRFFFRNELDLALNQAGLSMHTLSGFGQLDKPADETSWNVVVVAK
jgi:SAM-dependent methyltransferase